MIRVVGLTQHYGIRPVLSDITLEIPTGTLVSILGPNGMGKSTLLGVIAGVLTPQEGFVEIDGARRKQSAEAELEIRRKVIYLPDKPWLPGNRTGREFLLATASAYSIPPVRQFDHVDRLLQLFELEARGDSPIRSYSAGQQKKIALCSALITEAPVLLLDEPFSGGLDPSGILALRSVLRRLTRELGATVVMTTPVPELAEDLADQFVVIRDGVIPVAGTLEDLQSYAECTGTLADVLERLISPRTLSNLDHYFAGRS